MTEMDSAPNDKQELQFTLDLIEGAIISGDYLEALQMAEKALNKADEQHWVDIFEGLIERITTLQEADITINVDQKKSTSSKIVNPAVKPLEQSLDPIEARLDNLSLIPGVGPAMLHKLQEAGYQSFAQLAKTSPEKLSRINGIGASSAVKIISAAKKRISPPDFSFPIQKLLQVNTSTNYKSEEPTIQEEEDLVKKHEPQHFTKDHIDDYNNESKYSPGSTEIKQPKLNSGIDLEEQKGLKEFEIERCKLKNHSHDLEEFKSKIDKATENRLVESYSEESLISLIKAIFEDNGYSLIQKKVKIQGIDGIACKMSIISPSKQLVILIPYKVYSSNEKFIISETEMRFQGTDSNSPTPLLDTSLRNVVEILNEKIYTKSTLLISLSSILEEEISLQKTAIRIEPLLICKKSPGFTEKAIPFAYQRRNSLHFISQSQLSSLLEFLERKLYYIESYALSHRETSIPEISKEQLNRNIHRISYPFIGFGVFYALIIGIGWYFMLKYLIIIGYASFIIYLCGLIILWWKYRSQEVERITKNKYTQYPQKLEFEEGDLIMIYEELSLDQMSQFIYECFGKNIPYKIVERIEKTQMENMKLPSSLIRPPVNPPDNLLNKTFTHKKTSNNDTMIEMTGAISHDAAVPLSKDTDTKPKPKHTSVEMEVDDKKNMELVRKYSAYLND